MSNAAATKQKQQSAEVRQLEQRWTKALIAPGWTALPTVILERQHALGLDAVDVNILMHLASFWWYRDNPSHPSKARIAASMNVDVSTIRKRIARLEKDGIVRREARFTPAGRQETNYYHFDGLIKEATPFAEEALVEKQRRKQEADARRKRKKPTIRLVKTDEGDV